MTCGKCHRFMKPTPDGRHVTCCGMSHPTIWAEAVDKRTAAQTKKDLGKRFLVNDL